MKTSQPVAAGHPERIELVHGAGGRASAQLIERMFIRAFDNPMLQQQNDQARFDVPTRRLVMTTDAHVVSPLFFPGGDIGSLAVHGTLNDIAMAGAEPLYLAVSFILEEGLLLRDLQRIVASMARASEAAGVPIVTGDTKVVERGKADGVFITTSAIGSVPKGVDLSADRAQPGDQILLSGTIGDHGVAILSARDSLGFTSPIRSDSAALHDLVKQMVRQVPTIRCMRDPTRGGLATALNEICQQSGVGMLIDEQAVAIAPVVQSACELLGLDPYYMANEGKLIAICPAAQADRLLTQMRAHPLGQGASRIGVVTTDPQAMVELQTALGGIRLLDWLHGDPLPRIC